MTHQQGDFYMLKYLNRKSETKEDYFNKQLPWMTPNEFTTEMKILYLGNRQDS